LQPAATGCNRLQQAATGCHTYVKFLAPIIHDLPYTLGDRLQQAATGCNRLQQAATGCHDLPNTLEDRLQHTASHCNTLHHTYQAFGAHRIHNLPFTLQK